MCVCVTFGKIQERTSFCDSVIACGCLVFAVVSFIVLNQPILYTTCSSANSFFDADTWREQNLFFFRLNRVYLACF